MTGLFVQRNRKKSSKIWKSLNSISYLRTEYEAPSFDFSVN